MDEFTRRGRSFEEKSFEEKSGAQNGKKERKKS